MHNNSIEEVTKQFNLNKYETEVSKKKEFTELEKMGGFSKNNNDPMDQI